MILFRPNLARAGRVIRGGLGAVLVVAGFIALRFHILASVGLWLAGVFALFEALRGWCVMRACGIRTKY
jgi:hypothetical protein